MAETRLADVVITCPCCGASRSITVTRYKLLGRLESPAHEAALHRLATGGRP